MAGKLNQRAKILVLGKGKGILHQNQAATIVPKSIREIKKSKKRATSGPIRSMRYMKGSKKPAGMAMASQPTKKPVQSLALGDWESFCALDAIRLKNKVSFLRIVRNNKQTHVFVYGFIGGHKLFCFIHGN